MFGLAPLPWPDGVPGHALEEGGVLLREADEGAADAFLVGECQASRQADGALAVFPLAALLKEFDALETFENGTLSTGSAAVFAGLQNSMQSTRAIAPDPPLTSPPVVATTA